MYLGFFEQIVAATVRQLGGPADWALPYWNYSDRTNPNVRRVPPAFRAARLPDGSANPLRVGQRVSAANNGSDVATVRQVDLKDCMEEKSYAADSTGGAAGFGGSRTGFSHSGAPGQVPGDVERVPHGSIHVAVGGREGWMSAFDTAGLDPLFWLHHCNIDRLWAVWLRRDPRNANPTEAKWLTAISFEFHAATGEVVKMTSSQVTDTTAAPFSYKYEDISDPLGGAPVSPRESARSISMEDRPIPEMVGATDQPVTLTGEATTASLPVSRPTGPAVTGRESAAAPKRLFLNIENVTSAGQPDSYAVYVNLPPGADPEAHSELYAGLLPMFGVAESTDTEREHSGNGLHYSLEITDVVRVLEARSDWDPDEMRVTFVPERPSTGRETAAVGSPVQVGRVSLYHS
jgi:tyrosinase